MKVIIINKSDQTGGAAVVSFRLMNALREAGVDAKMLVVEKLSDSPFVEKAGKEAAIRIPFLAERLRIFIANGFNRSTLFKIDTASDGLPLSRHPLVRNADIICLNWINQGMLSLKEIGNIAALGKPVVWTMHDMWNFTGICHHAGECRRFIETCCECPLLGGRASDPDLSTKTMGRKQKLYDRAGIAFIAVSNWLADLARKSALLGDERIEVIPNAFPIDKETSAAIYSQRRQISETLRKKKIIFGAARLDDPIKGLPILKDALRILKDESPEEASGLELVTFGSVKDPSALEGMSIAHRHLGKLKGEEAVRNVYMEGDIVVSTSLYETLPGTLVEGQAYGCIPVSFNRGGQSDIIDHGISGYLCEFNPDSIEANARAIAEGIKLAAHAPEEMRRHMMEDVVDKFSATSVAGRYIGLFKDLLEK